MNDEQKELTLTEKLKAPFPVDDYEWRVDQLSHDETSARVLCYVTARAIQSRLDEVFGPYGWKTEYKAGPDGGVVCSLSAYNPDTKEWVSKEDGAPNTNISSVKGGISGALKRAGYCWGIGRHLYKLESTWVNLQTGRAKNYCKTKGGARYWADPPLPAWAVKGNGSPPPGQKKPPATQPTQKKPPQTTETQSVSKKRVWWTLLSGKCEPLNIQLPNPRNNAAVDAIAFQLYENLSADNQAKEAFTSVVGGAESPLWDELWKVANTMKPETLGAIIEGKESAA